MADKICLRYLAKKMAGDKRPVRFKVSLTSFRDIFIAIPVQTKLPEWEAINVALLNAAASEKWQDTLHQWLVRDRE